MLTRTISGLAGLVLLFTVLFSPAIVLTVAICIVSSIAVFEGLRVYGLNKYKIFILAGILSSVAFALATYIDKRIIFLSLFFIYVFLIAIMLKQHKDISTGDLFTVMFITLVIPFSFSTLGYIRNMENGVFLVWLPLISAWLTDTMAYFGGRFLGKRKLAPTLSPKKTIEGSITGIIGAVAGYIVYALMLKNIWSYEVNIINFVIISLLTSVISQIGDIFASSMKRENNIKDFGNIMPGHGGVLDRFDSLILTAPCIYICLMFIG